MAHINCTTKIFDLPKYLRFSRQSHNQKICNKSCKINKFFDQNYHSFMTLNFDEIHIYTCNPIKSTVLSSPMNIKRLTCKKARKKTKVQYKIHMIQVMIFQDRMSFWNEWPNPTDMEWTRNPQPCEHGTPIAGIHTNVYSHSHQKWRKAPSEESSRIIFKSFACRMCACVCV